MSDRALILAPRGRDASLAQAILAEADQHSEIVGSVEELVIRLRGEAGFAVVTEEALRVADTSPLMTWRKQQPAWSDFPFILLTERGGVERNPAASRYFDLLGNVTFVERPFHPTTLVALARAAIRGRRKQYDARARLEALHRGEERFRAAVEAVEGVLWTNSAVGRMEGEQAGWGALTGQTFEEYQGFGWADAVHPEDAQATIDAWNIAVEHKSLFAFEHRVRCHGGQWRTFSIRAIPTFTTDGKLREWVGVHTDVTDRRAAEAALRELNVTLEDRVAAALEERKVLADIFETTDSFVHVIDADFRWLAFNRAASNEFARLFNRRPVVGASLIDMLADFPVDQATARSVWSRALNGEEFTDTHIFGSASLEQRTYEMKFNTLRDSSGNRVGAFQLVTDVTRRIQDAARLVETQEALRQAQKMEAIGQLTGGVAHDFNNLLTIIQGGAEYLRRPDIPAEKQRRYVDAIFEASDRAAKLTHQLLAFSRRQPLRPTVFDVGERVSATSDMLRSIVGGRISMDVVWEDGLRANADVAQFETALVNLCVNARDAMNGEGKLAIRAYLCGDEVCIDVRDEGQGIAPHILPRLFEPFFTTKEVGKGTGLGLSQVYGFAHQSGGDVRVESELNVGTCFTLSLPSSNAAETTRIPVARISNSGARRVLVVEDNDDLRDFATTLLTELGHTVDCAGSAHDALSALAAAPGKFEVLFTDVVMAGMSGLDLAKQVREQWPDIKIVLASGYSDALLDTESLDFPLVSKPYSAEQLAAAF